MKMKVFKNSLVQRLKDSISENIERYQSGDFAQWIEHEHESDLFELDIPEVDAIDFEALNTAQGDAVDDDRDVKLLFLKLQNLPPAIARDARVWVTLCHMHALPYIRKRNPKLLTASGDELKKLIGSRFFIVDGGRGYERTNALARLWWYGYIAKKTGVDFDKAVHALVENTGNRADIVERPGIAACGNYMTAMTQVLVDAKESKSTYFNNRAKYRPMLMAVFETAGRKFFPSMGTPAIKHCIEEQIKLHKA
jgi:hypothetical protein